MLTDAKVIVEHIEFMLWNHAIRGQGWIIEGCVLLIPTRVEGVWEVREVGHHGVTYVRTIPELDRAIAGARVHQAQRHETRLSA